MLNVLKDEIDAHLGLNDYELATERYSALTKLTDSLHVNNMNYFSKEAREDLQREHVIARQNLQLSIGISVLIILVLLMLAAFLHHLLTRKRTKMMMATIDELMYYRGVVLQNGDRVSVEMGENDAVLHEEKRRFKEMDKRIIKEELFRSPDFGRDDLMRLMGVDKNAIAPIVQKYAHTNVSGYVKMKRMEYAVALLKEHPELTIAAIADMCGIKSTTTFVNRFKETYGMAPCDYRASIVDSAPPQ
jgi:AraC-like DNA-binding protein